MEFHNSTSFPKRRSYPNLQHISLAPLTPRFPIDDEDTDTDQTDYFNYHQETPHSPENTSGTRTPTRSRSSYLSSVSVPSTPPILSHSRGTSRTRRHSRSKSSTRTSPSSDTNLARQSVSFPLHHNGAQKKYGVAGHGATHSSSSKSDAEWLLRAGIALASSTREEKGQSWLVKRESSTSLVEMPNELAPHHHRHHHRTKSGSSRKSRSGASTPAWSRANSRRGSRAGLAMTSLPSGAGANGPGPSLVTGSITPELRGRSSGSGAGLVPDFVDEKIRAEMVSIQERERGLFGEEEEDVESEYDYFSDETNEEFDEADLQRLTRERGFGLGGWIDRLVEWTLFGVDELPVVPAATSENRIGAAATTTTVTFEEPVVSPRGKRGEDDHDNLSLDSEGDRHSLSDDADTFSHTDAESTVGVEKPGARGGWEDASWLFRVVKRALV